MNQLSAISDQLSAISNQLAGVVVLLAVTGVLAQANMHASAWVLMPVGVVIVLAISLRRATAR